MEAKPKEETLSEMIDRIILNTALSSARYAITARENNRSEEFILAELTKVYAPKGGQ